MSPPARAASDPFEQVDRAITTLREAQEIIGRHSPRSDSRLARAERLLNLAQAHLRSALIHAGQDEA